MGDDWDDEGDDPADADGGPGEHDAHPLDDADESTVPCPACGKPIWAEAERCPKCGVYFAGEAWEGRVAGGGGRSGSRRTALWRWTAVVLLLLAAFSLFAVGRIFLFFQP